MVTLHEIEIKVGDKVWDSDNGWDEVISLDGNEYYIIETNYSYYSTDGKLYRNDTLPRLFWNEFENS
jgi:major membrane immunogen (membrane-anchored lipoprotein)